MATRRRDETGTSIGSGCCLFEVSAARDGYLRLATFHGYLELAIAARWFTEGRRG